MNENRCRYENAPSACSNWRTAPVPYHSGNFAKAYKRFACVKPLRNTLHQFAWQSTLQRALAY